jgi:hypothetical protein
MKTILVYGLRRSGNHYIISTIIQKFNNWVHINDTKLCYDKYIEYKNIEKDKNRSDAKYTGFNGVDCVIISMENKIMENDYNEINKLRQTEDCSVIMLLRTPYSHFSSVWKVYKKQQIPRLRTIVKLWKIYANFFINNTDGDIVKILYDRFSTDNNYRCDIFQQLGLEYSNINEKFKIRNQSSSFKDDNESRQVYNTIDNCIFNKDDEFLKLTKDEEVENLFKKIINVEL